MPGMPGVAVDRAVVEAPETITAEVIDKGAQRRAAPRTRRAIRPRSTRPRRQREPFRSRGRNRPLGNPWGGPRLAARRVGRPGSKSRNSTTKTDGSRKTYFLRGPRRRPASVAGPSRWANRIRPHLEGPGDAFAGRLGSWRHPQEVGLSRSVGFGCRVLDFDHDERFVRPPPVDPPHRQLPEATGLVLVTKASLAFADESIEPESLDENAAPLGVGLAVDRLDGDGFWLFDHLAVHGDPVPGMDREPITEGERRSAFCTRDELGTAMALR